MNVNYTFDIDKAASLLGLMGNEARMHVLLPSMNGMWVRLPKRRTSHNPLCLSTFVS